MLELAVAPTRAFVLGLADVDGHLDAGALYDLADGLGVSTTSVRLTLRRMAEGGLLVSDGRGRNAQVTLTDAGLAVRAPDLGWMALAYRLDDRPEPWDRRWHVVSFEIPEGRRSARDALRADLLGLCGSHLAGGLYLHHFAWEPWVRASVDQLGIRQHVTMLTTEDPEVGGERDPELIASALWPEADTFIGGADFVARFGPVGDAPPDDLATATGVVFAASAQFEALARRDPLLPAELQGAVGPGPEIRRVFRRALEALARRHPQIARANVFAAFANTIDGTGSMTDAEFARWFWAHTRPRRTNEAPTVEREASR